MFIIKDIAAALANIAVKVYGAFYDYDTDVKEKKGIKHKDTEQDANKGFWAKTKAKIWDVIDFFFGPSTLKVISFLSIGFLALSPFGPLAIGIAAGISVLTLGLGLAIEGSNLKNLRTQQKEALALETITELHIEKLTTLDKNPELKNILDSVLKQDYELDEKDKTLRIKNILQHFPEALIPLVGNIMTGNLISIGAGGFCVVVGAVSAVNEQKSFSKQRKEMYDIIQDNKDMLRDNGGLNIDYPKGAGLDFLKDCIRDTEAEIQAIKNIQNKIKTGEINVNKPEQVKEQFKAELSNAKEELKTSKADNSKFEVHGIKYYTKKAFFSSFSYDNSREIFAPLAHYEEAKHNEFRDFYQDREKGKTLEIPQAQKDNLQDRDVPPRSFVQKLDKQDPQHALSR